MLSMIVATMLPMFTLATDQECNEWTDFLTSDEMLNNKLKKIGAKVCKQTKMLACYEQYFPASNLVYKIEAFKHWYYQSCPENKKVILTKKQQRDLTIYQTELKSFLQKCANKTSAKKNITELSGTRLRNCARITEAFADRELFRSPAHVLHEVLKTQQTWDWEAECIEWAKFLKSEEKLENKLNTIHTTARTQLKSDVCYAEYFPASNLVYKIETFTHWYREECAENGHLCLTKQERDDLTSYQEELISFLDDCTTNGADKTMQTANMAEMSTLRPSRCKQIKDAFVNGNLFNDPRALMRGLLSTEELWDWESHFNHNTACEQLLRYYKSRQGNNAFDKNAVVDLVDSADEELFGFIGEGEDDERSHTGSTSTEIEQYVPDQHGNHMPLPSFPVVEESLSSNGISDVSSSYSVASLPTQAQPAQPFQMGEYSHFSEPSMPSETKLESNEDRGKKRSSGCFFSLSKLFGSKKIN